MRVLLGGVLTVVVLSACAIAYVVVSGLKSQPSPGAVETRLARAVRRAAIPRSARARKNPEPATSGSLKDGMEHFSDHCAICHANDGSGNVEMGRGLYPKPPDLREAATQNLTDGELFYIIENGVRFTGMPAFGGGTGADGASEQSSWRLVHFIRHLPSLIPDELEQMKRLNPKSPEEIEREQEEQRFLEGHY